jgi:hypothetical protein
MWPTCITLISSPPSQGTLDALWREDDQVAMLRECSRLLAHPYGLIISVSFAAPRRLALLASTAPQLGLQWRVHVLGGDPARGQEVGEVAW